MRRDRLRLYRRIPDDRGGRGRAHRDFGPRLSETGLDRGEEVAVHVLEHTAAEQDVSIRAFRDEVVAAIGTKNLVDVRSPDEFSGKIKAPAHLPLGSRPICAARSRKIALNRRASRLRVSTGSPPITSRPDRAGRAP